MKAIIITIGDELLIGQVINTNAAYIAGRLNEVGIDVVRMTSVGDVETEILSILQETYTLFDVIIITGGLGPTHDDITRTAICKFFNTDLISNDEARENVQRILQQRNSVWSEAAENQTLVPRGATVIQNLHGTAPGEFFERENKYIVVMPGVPYEMQSMVDEFVVPYFRKKNTGQIVLHLTLNTTGISESLLAERLGNLENLLSDASLAFLPSPSGVRLRITLKGNDRSLCESKIKRIELQLRIKAGKFIYGIEDETLEEIVGRLLTERQFTIAVAESCTGGMIAHRLTNIPGSSAYFERAIVAYSNQSKIQHLNVPPEVIERFGAVSKEAAEAMAEGVRQISGVNIGISTTGIAGPTGGTQEKPVGLVWIGYADAKETSSVKFLLGDNRLRVKERASQAALDLIRRKVLHIE